MRIDVSSCCGGKIDGWGKALPASVRARLCACLVVVSSTSLGAATGLAAQTLAAPQPPAVLQSTTSPQSTTAPKTVAPQNSPTAPQAGASVAPPSPPVLPSVEAKPAAPAPAAPIATTDGLSARTPAVPHELSPWSMFLAADIVVKGVMVGLMFASLVTWTIFIGKTIELAAARRRLTRALKRMSDATMVCEAQRAVARDDFVADLLSAAKNELDLSGGGASREGVKERSESRFADLVRVETQSMRRGMGLLATIGSTAPFVGLFGTVWGIMNSFIGISKSQTTNLAVVAPGIAEALLATAIGLVAAIPAVIIYNHFSRATRSYQLLITRAAGVVTRLLSREVDRQPRAAGRAAE